MEYREENKRNVFREQQVFKNHQAHVSQQDDGYASQQNKLLTQMLVRWQRQTLFNISKTKQKQKKFHK